MEFNPLAADGLFGQYDMLTKRGEMTETQAHGYSFDSTKQELSDEYQPNRIKMIFINRCLCVH